MRSEDDAKRVSAWLSSALIVLLTVAGVAVIGSLSYQNRVLKEAVSNGGDRRQGLPSLVKGDLIPALETVDVDGVGHNFTEVTGDGGLLLFFTTTCPYCKATLPHWSELYADLSAKGISVVAVSLDGALATSAYVLKHSITMPVWVLASTARRGDLKVSSVPFTVLVSADGQVSDAWRGALRESDGVAIRQATRQLLASGDAAAATNQGRHEVEIGTGRTQ